MRNPNGGITGARKRPEHKPVRPAPDTTFLAEQIEYAEAQIQIKQRTQLTERVREAWKKKQNGPPSTKRGIHPTISIKRWPVAQP